MAITASEARRELFPLIEKVNDDRTAIEITSKDRGNAVLMSLRSMRRSRRPPTCCAPGERSTAAGVTRPSAGG